MSTKNPVQQDHYLVMADVKFVHVKKTSSIVSIKVKLVFFNYCTTGYGSFY